MQLLSPLNMAEYVNQKSHDAFWCTSPIAELQRPHRASETRNCKGWRCTSFLWLQRYSTEENEWMAEAIRSGYLHIRYWPVYTVLIWKRWLLFYSLLLLDKFLLANWGYRPPLQPHDYSTTLFTQISAHLPSEFRYQSKCWFVRLSSTQNNKQR